MGFETQDVQRKVISILRVLLDSHQPVGSRVIASRLKDLGIELGERDVRYHLKLMDERGLTRLVTPREGRVLTDRGVQEVMSALAKDRVGFAISRIETLALRTDFNYADQRGSIPINVSFFPRETFNEAVKIMKPIFRAGLSVSNLVAVAQEGEMLGEVIVPQGRVGLATVCSVVINGALLKAGVPIVSRYSGILEIKNNEPFRFVELIDYSGCSLDPSDIFIRAKMTSVREVIKSGNGRILATYREIPALCRPIAEQVLEELGRAGLRGLLVMGKTSEPVCEMPIELNRVGMVLINGLNPVAAIVEAGIEVENRGMSTVMEYQNLIKFQELS